MADRDVRKARAITARTGIVPGPNSPLLEVSGRACRDEDAEGELCDSLIRQITGRSGVVNLSQKRASQVTVGLPDRRYRVHDCAFFWELKAEDGQLTASQHAFLLDELQHGAPAACGGLEDLVAFVERLKSIEGKHYLLKGAVIVWCRELIDRWAAKGYRREPQSRPRRRR